MGTSMPTDISPIFDEPAADWWSAAMTVGCAENVDTTDDADDDYLANMCVDYDLSMWPSRVKYPVQRAVKTSR